MPPRKDQETRNVTLQEISMIWENRSYISTMKKDIEYLTTTSEKIDKKVDDLSDKVDQKVDDLSKKVNAILIELGKQTPMNKLLYRVVEYVVLAVIGAVMALVLLKEKLVN